MAVKTNPLTPMKLTVRTINVLGFIFYFGYISLLVVLFGMPSKLYLSTFLVLTPFLYFLVCIATSFAHRSKSVLLTGIVFHGIVAFASVAALTGESYWPCFLFIIYAAAWFMMYFKLSPA